MKRNHFAPPLVEAPCAITTTSGQTQPFQAVHNLKTFTCSTTMLALMTGLFLFTVHAGAQTTAAVSAARSGISPQTIPCILPKAVTRPELSKPCSPPPPPPPPPPPAYGYTTFLPKYYVLSVLYDAPGLKSSNAYSTGTSTGTTTSILSNLTAGDSISLSASGGLFGQATVGTSFGVSSSTQTGSAFQVSTAETSGAQLASSSDSVDHSQDRVFIWLNPQVTVTQTGKSTGTYTMGTPAGQQMDIIDVDVAELKNPSLIPPAKMATQKDGTPGLGILNATDFAQLLTADPLVSGVDIACSPRFTLIQTKPLEGPDYAGENILTIPVTVSDQNIQTDNYSTTVGFTTSVSLGAKFGVFDLFDASVTNTQTFTWSNTQSDAYSTGTSHQASVALGTSTVGFNEEINIYEDNVYHTFAFDGPPSVDRVNACLVSREPYIATAPGATPAVSPGTLQGTVSTLGGDPAANVLVVFHVSDGTVRNIYTDRHGNFVLYPVPEGSVTLTVGTYSQISFVGSNQTTVANLSIQ